MHGSFRRRRGAGVVAVVLVVVLAGFAPVGAQNPPEFTRGDANRSSTIDISDAVFILSFLFIGGPPPHCPGIADVNGSGAIDIADAIALLSHLFSDGTAIRPLSAAETEHCRNPPAPVPVTVLRGGPFVTIQHDVRGYAEHLSDNSIRIRDFHYDGDGLPEVVVWLHRDRTRERQGMRISDDLRRRERYAGETLIFAIPAGITGDMWGYVSIWCTSVPTNYGYARMFR